MSGKISVGVISPPENQVFTPRAKWPEKQGCLSLCAEVHPSRLLGPAFCLEAPSLDLRCPCQEATGLPLGADLLVLWGCVGRILGAPGVHPCPPC